MIDLKDFKGFCVVKGDSSKEALSLYVFCTTHDIPYIYGDKHTPCPQGYVPCGSVEWCLLSLDHQVTPDYYPEFLSKYLYRKVWRYDKWIMGEKLFVKPADTYKRFDGKITSGVYSGKKKPPFWWSEIVKFENEFRYYISHGKILAGEWYWGSNDNMQAPEFTIEIPSDFCGALDFGFLSTGEFALIEAQHPFACGWYGKDHENYFQWLIDGWEYMLKIKNEIQEVI